MQGLYYYNDVNIIPGRTMSHTCHNPIVSWGSKQSLLFFVLFDSHLYTCPYFIAKCCEKCNASLNVFKHMSYSMSFLSPHLSWSPLPLVLV